MSRVSCFVSIEEIIKERNVIGKTCSWPSDSTYLRVTINSGSFASGDVIDNGSGVTGTLNNNQTTYDTITYTDGVVTETNVPTFSEPTYFVNGLLFVFGATTGHTLTNEWTWDYTTVNQNVLDFSNNDYKFQSVFGTDTFGYHIGDNLFGYGIKGSLNTYTNVAGDQMLTGYADVTGAGFIGFYSLNLYSTGEIATMSAKKNGIGYSLKDSFGENIVQTSSGVTTLGNIDGGNNTKITIDDVNETIAFDANGNTVYSSDIPLSIKVTVPSADILALVSGPTPYQLIPAPGAGKTIQILGSIMSVDFNTTAYDFSFSARDVYVGNESVGNGVAFSALNSSSSVINQSNNFTSDIKENEAISLFALPSVTVSQGDSDVDFYITYKIVTL